MQDNFFHFSNIIYDKGNWFRSSQQASDTQNIVTGMCDEIKISIQSINQEEFDNKCLNINKINEPLILHKRHVRAGISHMLFDEIMSIHYMYKKFNLAANCKILNIKNEIRKFDKKQFGFDWNMWLKSMTNLEIIELDEINEPTLIRDLYMGWYPPNKFLNSNIFDFKEFRQYIINNLGIKNQNTYKNTVYIDQKEAKKENIKHFYSQHGEDAWLIENIFKEKSHGFFVELGATEGENFSNTYYLAKYNGWKGILIEPRKDSFAALKKLRSESICLNCCISDKIGEQVRFLHNKAASGIIRTNRNHIDHNSQIEIFKTTTLTQIFDTHHSPKTIDFLSLDVEGHEVDVLKGIDFQRYIILIMLVEHGNHKNEILRALPQEEYEIIREIAGSLLIIHKSAHSKFNLNPEIKQSFFEAKYKPHHFLVYDNMLEPNKIIFVDRPYKNKFSRRCIQNYDEFNKLVSQIPNSEFVQMETLSFKDQVEKAMSAKLFVAVHGAAITHSFFMQPNTHVVEIMPHGFEYTSYKNYAESVGVNYHLFEVEQENFDDFTVEKALRQNNINISPQAYIDMIRNKQLENKEHCFNKEILKPIYRDQHVYVNVQKLHDLIKQIV